MRAATLLALAGAWRVAGYFLWQTRIPSGLRLPHLRPGRLLRPRTVDARGPLRALAGDRLDLLTQVALGRRLRRLREVRRALHARVGGRPDRHGDAARDARVRVRVARPAPVRDRRPLVGAPLRRAQDQLPRPDPRCVAGRMARPRLHLPLSLGRRPDRDGHRGLPPRSGGSPRRPSSSRSACCRHSSRRTSSSRRTRFATRSCTLAADRIQRAEGLSGIEVRVQDVHDFTPTENAFATGLGPSRKVFVWDTLLSGGLERPEIEVVLAHEFAHLARDHLWKQLAWFALFAFPEAYLVALVARRRGGMAQAGGSATCAARDRRLLARDDTTLERDQPPLRGRGRLDSAPDDEEPGCSRRPVHALRHRTISPTRTLRRSRTCCSRTTRRCCQRIAMAQAWKARNPGG